MPPQSSDKGSSVCQTCLCCMCRCSDHECFDQQACRLPAWMQEMLQEKYPDIPSGRKADKLLVQEALDSIPPNNLYTKTTYNSDFCSERRFIDHFPLEQKQLHGSIKPPEGAMLKSSIYRNDFVPWDRDEQDLCRAKLMNPMKTEYRKDDVQDRVVEPGTMEKLRSYYCPPHCVGLEEEPVKESCLEDYKERFNIGPPASKKRTRHELPEEPFEKFTNYKLDYKNHGVIPSTPRKPAARQPGRSTLPPLSRDTSYRDAFAHPPAVEATRPSKPDAKPGSLTVGDGPMEKQTTAMLDFKDHDVQARRPFRPPRAKFQPPKNRMDGVTTTASSFPRWTELPTQVEPIKPKIHYKPLRDGARPLVTTYQEDFHGINRALCPGTILEKAGPRVLLPRLRFEGSEKGHDFFKFREADIDREMVACSH